MKLAQSFEPEHVKTLQAFYSASETSDEPMTYSMATGFLFVVACSPELVPPSAWVPFLIEEQEFDDKEQADKVFGALMALYNELIRQVQEEEVALLIDCDFHPEPLDNFLEDAPIHQWNLGFIIAHEWLHDMWDDLVPPELDEEYGAQLMMLSFFADKEAALEMHDESNFDGPFEVFVSTFQDNFTMAMASFADLGSAMRKTLQQQVPVRSEKIGRNEPCPCGSGKKYKKCCALKLH